MNAPFITVTSYDSEVILINLNNVCSIRKINSSSWTAISLNDGKSIEVKETLSEIKEMINNANGTVTFENNEEDFGQTTAADVL